MGSAPVRCVIPGWAELAGKMSRAADDEVRLGEAVRAGAEQCRAATEELVRHNRALVLRVAVTADAALPLEDRVQAGNLGLLQAVEKYDPAVGTKFSTYAVWWIRHAIDRAVANEGRMIRLPVHMHDRVAALAKARRRLAVDEHPVDDGGLCAALGWSASELATVRAAAQVRRLSWESELSCVAQ
ncbi:RNA polymerase primary sigma factor [Propionibacteriaceae bacterium ES.041]|nr:RNA polymerase primary sigma factor [Propionibacteriaceae bacterium ES.041]